MNKTKIKRLIETIMGIFLMVSAASAISNVDQGFQAGWFVGDIANGTINSTSISSLIGNQSYSYLIWRSGNTYYAKNGSTGKIDYSGTDFNTVMQNAISVLPTTGGTIKLSSGTFAAVNTSEINITSSVIIEGSGRYGLYFNGNYWEGYDFPAGTIITYPGNGTLFRISQSYVTIRDIVLKNTNVGINNASSAAINATTSTGNGSGNTVGLNVEGVLIAGSWYIGINLKNAINTNIRNNVFDGNSMGQFAIRSDRHNCLNIEKNYIHYWDVYGTYLNETNTVKIQQNIYESITGTAIILRGSNEVDIDNNYFENNDNYNIIITSSIGLPSLFTGIENNNFIPKVGMTADVYLEMATGITLISNDFQSTTHKNILTISSQVQNLISINNYFRNGSRDAATGGGSTGLDISLDYQMGNRFNIGNLILKGSCTGTEAGTNCYNGTANIMQLYTGSSWDWLLMPNKVFGTGVTNNNNGSVTITDSTFNETTDASLVALKVNDTYFNGSVFPNSTNFRNDSLLSISAYSGDFPNSTVSNASLLTSGTVPIARLDDDIVYRSISTIIYNNSGSIAIGMKPQIYISPINGTIEKLSIQNGLADGNINISILKSTSSIPTYSDILSSIAITSGSSSSSTVSYSILEGDKLKVYVESNPGAINSTTVSLRIRAT